MRLASFALIAIGILMGTLRAARAQQPMGDMPGMQHMSAAKASGVKLTLSND
jgi:hypothetical protein